MPPAARSRPADNGTASVQIPGEKIDTEATPIPRQPEAPCAFDYLRREHADREHGLRRELNNAIRSGDEPEQRRLLAHLDDLYTARAGLRSQDREIRRYRRLLREAA